MKGLGLLLVLLLFLSWRRGVVAGNGNRNDIEAWFEEAEKEAAVSPIHVNAIRHKVLFPRLAMRERLRDRQGRALPASTDPFLKNTLLRHTARMMDRLLTDTMATANGTLLHNIHHPHHHHNHSGLENLTISQLIENLRGLRARRRRSSLVGPKIGELQLQQGKKGFGKDRPSKKVAEIDGQIVLGGLMMVHERGDQVTCGPIMPQVRFFQRFL
jgi:hypothetical protein